MAARTSNSPWSKWSKNVLSGGQWYIVSPSGTAQYAELGQMYPVDTEDGLPRVYTTVAAVFAQSGAIVSGRRDKIFLTPDYTTALTATDLLNAETNGVEIVPLTASNEFGYCTAFRATGSLPAGTQTALFTVTGKVKILDIIGEVTTVVQTQTCNTKLVANPTVGADVDICATTDITAAAVGTNFNITGTFANGLVVTASGANVSQAAPTTVYAGTIDLSTSATNTGSVKWQVRYLSVDPGARVLAA